ncbi:serine/threonine-protein kinase D6PKL2 [Asparagus officinalis]|uniref:serine/threonine-protein kinase D6PKL2 n=1 Tax=Asparagus officinalis TaxID=4686 RepID=UPI00098E7B95|nr:serine/threonine-protein kinase D6PKL2 [Asparagus officinalis]
MPDDLADDLNSMSFGSSETISTASSASGPLSSGPHRKLTLADLRFVQRLGSGDIGSVYLAELKCASPSEGCMLAAKVMDKKELEGRNKEGRARTEREILEMLGHPFLPKLYGVVENERWSCLLTEFCPGGDLHVLRQRQRGKRFDEAAVRLGAVQTRNRTTGPGAACVNPSAPFNSSSCIIPNCIVPAVSCFHPKSKRRRKPGHRSAGGLEFVAEPVDLRSMSFVGTHEYLAPEIVSGEGHGSTVDWWTLGVFIFELLYGVTPFKGSDNELTLANIVARALEFPKDPPVSSAAKDLIAGLLAKDPIKRMGSATGATTIKRHPFFTNVNWALLRCASPPYVPPPFSRCNSSRDVSEDDSGPDTPVDYY